MSVTARARRSITMSSATPSRPSGAPPNSRTIGKTASKRTTPKGIRNKELPNRKQARKKPVIQRLRAFQLMAKNLNSDRNRLSGCSAVLKWYFHMKYCGKIEVIYFNIPSAMRRFSSHRAVLLLSYRSTVWASA